MANNPQKSKDASKDPTEQAISAIEDALNVRNSDLRIEPSFQHNDANEAARDSSRDSAPIPPVSADLFHEPEQPTQWASDDNALRQPANDDRANMGVILQTLRRRRARAPYVIASIAALG